MDRDLTLELSSKGYWPAVAMEYLMKKKYSKAVELCQIGLRENPYLLSGHIVLARALCHSGQWGEAEEQFYRVLQIDPQNLIALKYLGDLKYRQGDEATALSYYERVLQIDPNTSGLSLPLTEKSLEHTTILTLQKGEEKSEPGRDSLRQIPFKTETVGDLLLAQGHPRLALTVFEELAATGQNPRVKEKIDRTSELLKNKDRKNV
ncbi:MAG: tetratricopeptide repeat protein [candidate division Zixibacteria bacterium]|nr:tetratricopeptide repeat protein [candidate division Zixibacteria bacterium]